MAPMAVPSAMRAPVAFASVRRIVSDPSSWLSSSTSTSTVFDVSAGANVRVPFVST